jgi:hypothetical protein
MKRAPVGSIARSHCFSAEPWGCYRSNVADEFDSERFPGNFYQGMILKLDRSRGRGVVRSHSGKEIPFEFPFVAVLGAGIGGTMPGIDLIREGDIIGFDVGWTSKGLRVTTIHPAAAQH